MPLIESSHCCCFKFDFKLLKEGERQGIRIRQASPLGRFRLVHTDMPFCIADQMKGGDMRVLVAFEVTNERMNSFLA